MNPQDLNALKPAYENEFKFHDENLLMLGWYARRIISVMKARKTRTVLSLGVGHQVLAKSIIEELGAQLAMYVVLEGSSELIETLRGTTEIPRNTEVVHTLFEQYRPPLKFDAIEMGFVLEHVDDPESIIRHFAELLSSDGAIFIAVPNARSLHRLIGYEAALLDNVYRLSAEDLQLGHQRYFDYRSLCNLILKCGLKIVNVEGILLKPMTTGQLRSLNLHPSVIEGLMKVAVALPEFSNAILVEATL